ncbi:MAG: hypothetical protein R3C28_30020 [Pirellulaceae bacterium]
MLKRFWTIYTLLPIAFLAGCGGSPEADFVQVNSAAVDELRTQLASSGSGTESDQEEQVGPSGYATLRGRFVLDGSPPPQIKLDISKDPAICAPGGKDVFANDVAVGANGGLANIVIFANGVNEDWVHDSAKPGRTEEIIFDQRECVFLTHVVGIQTGQPMKVLNSDPVAHNLKVSTTFNQTIPEGKSVPFVASKELNSPEKMSCSIHPWMTAYLLVRNDGYFAVTAEDGSFEISNLPAGIELEFRVWHERLNGIKGDLQVNGSAETWKKGRFEMTLEPSQDQELNVVLPAAMFN